MNSSPKTTIIVSILVLIIIAIAIGIWPRRVQAPQTQGAAEVAPTSATVIYGPQGFSPANVTIAQGGTVTFMNQGGGDMWVAGGSHPMHDGYDGTTEAQHCAPGATPSFDECATGTTYSFTFEKAGTWGYHNHVLASDYGTITVVAQ